MNIELIAHTPDPELVIANCATTCYDSNPKDIESSQKMIRSLAKAGHEAMIEHAHATFKLTGVSRALTHELVRHRLFSFAQRSQRYVKENEPSYVIPDVLVDDNSANPMMQRAKDYFVKAMSDAWHAYKTLLECGLKTLGLSFQMLALQRLLCLETLGSGVTS